MTSLKNIRWPSTGAGRYLVPGGGWWRSTHWRTSMPFSTSCRSKEYDNSHLSNMYNWPLQEAEDTFYDEDDVCISWWWSGLTDMNDDGELSRTVYIIRRSYCHVSGIWEWPEGGRANFTFWHDAAVPNIQNYNCMQFLSATCYGRLNNKQIPINKSHQTSSSFLFRWTMDDFRLQWCLHQYTSNMPATELIKARDISELLNHEKCYITFNIIQ